MTDGTEKPAWRSTLVCCGVAIACITLPQPIQSAVRATVHDALSPGQHLAQPLLHSARWTHPDTGEPLAERLVANQELEQLRLTLRQQQLREAALRDQLKAARDQGVTPYTGQPSAPLVRHELLEARVLGREKDLSDQPALLVGLGSARGAVSEAFVVRGGNPILDQGSSRGIESGQPVYAGRCVVGRVERAGRWTSAVQLISDTRYTGRAQLLRESDDGSQFGAEGLLVGHGDGTCRLTGIPYTEPVAVGDDVYTGGRSARFPHPMYYGRVVAAELESGQRWNIIVKPHVAPDVLVDVAVLRQSLNTSERVLGQ